MIYNIYKSPYLWKQLHHMLLCLCHVMLLRLQANIWKQFDAISHCENYNMDWTKSCTWASSLFLDLSPLIFLPKKKANANKCITSKFQIFEQKKWVCRVFCDRLFRNSQQDSPCEPSLGPWTVLVRLKKKSSWIIHSAAVRAIFTIL